MNKLIQTGIEAAIKAGDYILKHPVSTINEKHDKSKMTDLDVQSEKIIVETILKKFPDHGILSEECGTITGKNGITWVIDPIDGTHNFINNIPLFAISIGILENNKFTGGIVFAPKLDRLYYGYRNEGAYCNNKPIAVSKKDTLKSCSLAIDSGLRHFDKRQYGILNRLTPEFSGTRMFGSSVLNLVFIADGTLDAVLEFDDYPWDYTAAVTILREAGGSISNLDGSEFIFGKRSYFASNSSIHEKALSYCLFQENKLDCESHICD